MFSWSFSMYGVTLPLMEYTLVCIIIKYTVYEAVALLLLQAVY